MASLTSESSSSNNSTLFRSSEYPADVADNDTLHSAKRRRTRPLAALNTWKAGRPRRPGEPEYKDKNRIWYCAHSTCNYPHPTWSTHVTGNARTHMLKAHGVTIAEEESLVKQATSKAMNMSIKESFKKADEEIQRREELKKDEVLSSLIKKDLILECLARLIVAHNLPYHAVEWPELRSLLILCNPAVEKVLISSHTTVPKLIEKAYKDRKLEAKAEMLDTPHQIHLSLDVWKAPNRRYYLGVCAHFVNRDGELKKYTIALPELRKGKGGKAQAIALTSILTEHEIYTKLGYIVGDNSYTNDALCREIEHWLQLEGITNWKAGQHRIRCQGHVINLIVQAFLFCESKEAVDAAIEELDQTTNFGNDLEDIMADCMSEASKDDWRKWGVLGRLHNFVIWLRTSSEQSIAFIELAGRMIPLDNDTRWNSWLVMIRIARQLKQAINKTFEDNYSQLKDDYLSPEDWQTLDDIYDFLLPFEEATKACEGDNSTLDCTLYTIDFLLSYLNTAEEQHRKKNSDSNFLIRIHIASYILDKYFMLYDEVPAYLGALLLHPNRRLQYVKNNWKKSWVKDLQPKVKTFWEEHYKDHIPPVEDEMGDDIESRFALWNKSQRSLAQFKDEYSSFIHSGCVQVKGPAYKWWLQPEQQSTYPNLARMAVDLLSIPPMSAEPERVFSGARRTISWERMRLGSTIIEQNECLKSFQRLRVRRDDSYIEELRALTAKITAAHPPESEMDIDSEVDSYSQSTTT